MYGIDILLQEHEKTLTLIDKIHEQCLKDFESNDIDIEFYNKVLDIGRNYVDKHHHGKEEEILFKIMIETLPSNIEHIINDGMLADHKIGRYYLESLEWSIKDYKAMGGEKNLLDVITNANGYANLMESHIMKENEVLYPYAIENLKEEDKKKINDKIMEAEKLAESKNIQNKYNSLISML